MLYSCFLVIYFICSLQCLVSGMMISSPSVKVSVFYAPLCSDSIKFINRQLNPVYTKLKNIMNLDLNAFGKATVSRNGDGSYNFSCQHGKLECDLSLVLACGKRHIMDVDKFLEWSFCVMTNTPMVVNKANMCANQLGIDYSAISVCSSGEEGATLLQQQAEKQSQCAPGLNYIPWNIINEVWTPSFQKEAEYNLLNVVCNTYSGPQPEACVKRFRREVPQRDWRNDKLQQYDLDHSNLTGYNLDQQ